MDFELVPIGRMLMSGLRMDESAEQDVQQQGSESIKNDAADAEQLRSEARRLFPPFGFTEAQKREVWEAFRANPDGVERCALRARATGKRNGNTGAGLLLEMLRRGDHGATFDPTARQITGWRFDRSTASGVYVEDPEGTDPLPPGYDFTPATGPAYRLWTEYWNGDFGPADEEPPRPERGI